MMKLYLTILVPVVWVVSIVVATAESGYQIIRGTQVYTVIDHARGVATFSNECGSQTLSQAQLQAGAYPDKIIPCNPATAAVRLGTTAIIRPEGHRAVRGY